jgi:hypothetical protein
MKSAVSTATNGSGITLADNDAPAADALDAPLKDKSVIEGGTGKTASDIEPEDEADEADDAVDVVGVGASDADVEDSLQGAVNPISFANIMVFTKDG